jgi:type III pantothenate kinase
VKLLVDLGNSRMKWAWLEGGALRDPDAAAHDGGAEAPLAALRGSARRVDEILVASVAAPALTAAVADGLAAALQAPARRIETSPVACGVRNGYRTPGQLGVDRWLGIVAAHVRYRQALCVVDAGTALTVDAVTGSGEHLGGFIVPGAALMRRTLLAETGRLAAAAGVDEREIFGQGFWGRDTTGCIALGAGQALAGLVERSLEELARVEGARPLVVLTGGGATGVRASLGEHALLHPLLVLEGMAAVSSALDRPPSPA